MKNLIIFLFISLFSSASFALVPAEQDWEIEAWKRIKAQHEYFEKNGFLINEGEIYQYSQSLFTALVPDLASQQQMELHVLKSLDPEAYSLPDGRLYMSLGLMAIAESESELASVLAHEIAHVRKQHSKLAFAQTLRQNKKKNIAYTFGLGIGGMITGLSVKGERSAFSIEHEEESDADALEIMKAAGFNLLAQAEMFKRMQTNNDNFGVKEQKYFKTHPELIKRAEDSLKRLSAYQAPAQNVVTNTTYEDIKLKVIKAFVDRVLESKGGVGFLEVYVEVGAFKKYADSNPDIMYGMAKGYQQSDLDLKTKIKVWKRFKNKKGERILQKPTQTDKEESTHWYKKLLALDENHVEGNYGLASIYAKGETPKSSLPYFKKFLAMSNQDHEGRRFAEFYIKKFQ